MTLEFDHSNISKTSLNSNNADSVKSHLAECYIPRVDENPLIGFVNSNIDSTVQQVAPQGQVNETGSSSLRYLPGLDSRMSKNHRVQLENPPKLNNRRITPQIPKKLAHQNFEPPNDRERSSILRKWYIISSFIPVVLLIIQITGSKCYSETTFFMVFQKYLTHGLGTWAISHCLSSYEHKINEILGVKFEHQDYRRRSNAAATSTTHEIDDDNKEEDAGQVTKKKCFAITWETFFTYTD